MLNRLSLLLALTGMLLALHLWIQKERNFDQGCWGVTTTATASATAGGCTNEELKKYSEFLGVSVAAWGYAFYFLTAALALGKILLPETTARTCQTASEVAVALAFPFSLYLVWVQAFVAKAFCPLCLLSSGLVAALFVLHAIQYRRGFVPVPEARRPVETGYAATMAFLAAGLLAALLLMVNGIATRRLDQGEQARQFEAMLARALPKQIDPQRLQEMKPALFNDDLPRLPLTEWLTGELPPLGHNPAVPVVVFLDPNCPSCKGSYAAIRVLAERYGDRAQFHVISRTLWPRSELQSQALELAAQAGKYHEMWQLQFDRAKKEGLTLVELSACFAALGLDTRDLETRLAAVRPAVLARRDRAMTAGIRGTPTLYISGRAVAQGSTDPASLAKLIEQASARAPARN